METYAHKNKTKRIATYFLRWILFIILFNIFFSVNWVLADSGKKTIICGIAEGFPPYQYRTDSAEPAGLDVDIMLRVAKRLQQTVIFQQSSWDKVITGLRLDTVDCISGIEINDKRKTYFDFTTPYYNRKNVVFVRQDNTDIHSIQDLKWQVVAGDRHSFVELYLAQIGLRSQIRLYQTDSKDTSIRMLKEKVVVAVIAPLEVGLYLAKKHSVEVRILDNSDPGSPVGIAVNKGNGELLNQIEKALEALKTEGVLDTIINRWRSMD
ncbi:transporter substrate-binding domain-containing protein [uncultured Pseudodesulfovibrio sp.]|uniref:transporter substrate-binding domain-containing protein n=1 Tax=uncultured Pseudodesulfovibrio sp. TaxID=2035858 RepID=UPI0029C6F9F9|nr:transporter substrate-binding domain-containing protein [uncultured Pseudodesulfovibrio sp.]